MLNITVQNSASAAKQYFSRSDYYMADAQELVGYWGGKGAALLGLSGEMDKESFDQLCDNINPATGRPLTPMNRENRRVGYDFTWSAPKSVSLVHALTGDERIVTAFRESIRETMGDMESEMQCRVRKGKKDTDRETGNMVYSEFIHVTSRPVNGVPCPQLHSHVVCFNGSFDSVEDRWKAGQFGAIKESAYFHQAAQQARFASKLKELGYSIRRTKDAFEISGVPQATLAKFSLRKAEIDKAAKEQGITDPKLREKLALSTREGKNHEFLYSELKELWDKRLEPSERQALLDVADGIKPAGVKFNDAPHVRYAADHLFARASVVDERRLLALALRHGCGEVTPEGVQSELNRLGVLKREEGGQTLVTTNEVLAEERKMLHFAVSGKGTCRPIIPDVRPVRKSLEGSILSGEQRAAVEHILCSSDRVTILRGVAGVGKTTLTHEAVRQMEEAGKGVVMVAPTAQASRGVLRDEGFDAADTLAALMKDDGLKEKARNGVIWVDEAGLVGTKCMVALFDVAKEYGSRVVLAGDKFQMSAVERGTALRVLEEMGGIKCAEVKDIRRQSGDYKSVVALLAQGKAVEGIDKLDAMGWVKTMAPEDGYREVAIDYVDKLKESIGRERVEKLHRSGTERDIERLQESKDKEKGVLIMCSTHAEGNKLVEAVRKELKAERLIGDDDHEFMRLVPLQWTPAQKADKEQYVGTEIMQFHRNSKSFKAGQRVDASSALAASQFPNADHFSVYGESSIRLAKGDIIKVTATGFSKDRLHKLDNGSVHTVDSFTKDGDIRLNNGWILDRSFGHVNFAYANTGFAAQGRTVQHTILVQSGVSHFAGGRDSLYVGVSRGRSSCTIYVDSKEELRRAAERQRVRLSAIELQRKPKAPWWKQARKRIERIQVAAMLAAKASEYQRPLKSRELSYGR